MKRPTIAKTFETKQRAERRFQGLIKGTWLIREQQPDFHIDYLVETEKNGEPSGCHFAVQLKGMRPQKGVWSRTVSIQRKHLRYYSEKVQFPVFLVLVNVTTNDACWLFLQKEIAKSISPANLRRKGSISLKVPAENNLIESDHFEKAVQEAHAYMQKIAPAIKLRKRHLEELDPRLDVGINFVDGQEQLKLIPKEPLEFCLKVKNDARSRVSSKLKRMIEFGEEVTIPKKSVQMVGSPLFEEINAAAKDGPLRMRWGCERGIQFSLREPENGNFVPITLPGVARLGTKMITFETNAPNSPLSLRVTVDPTEEGRKMPIDLKIGISPKKWLNQPLRQLAYYDSVRSICESLRGRGMLVLEVTSNGNLVYKAKISEGSVAIADGMEDVLSSFDRCRAVAERFKIAPTLPSKIQDLIWKLNLGGLVDQLLNNETIELQGHGMKVSVPVKGVGLNTETAANSTGPIEFTYPGRHFELFNEKIFIGPLHCRISQVKLGPCRINQTDGTTDMSWIGQNNSICEFTLLDHDGLYKKSN